MIVQYCSDLHLEFPENHKYIRNNPIKPIGDILVLAGDIVAFAALEQRKDFFSYIADNFATTYWIPGNHEYYDADISERSGDLLEKIRDNIYLVNNQSVVHYGTRFIFSTLWSAINEANEWRVENYISDFKTIRYQGKPFTAKNFTALHRVSLQFVTTELEKDWAGKTIVVSHHVPTYLHYPAKYRGDSLNEVFAVDLNELITATAPDYWIYGHHHCNTPAFKIASTSMLTNQLGYVHHYEYGSFQADKHIVI